MVNQEAFASLLLFFKANKAGALEIFVASIY